MSNYMLTTNGSFVSVDELYHWGVKGMKWGVRRYQKKDGSLTSAGKKRYSEGSNKSESDDKNSEDTKKKGLTDKQKKILIAGAVVAGTCLAAYGAYKISKLYKGAGQAVDPETGFRLLDKNTSDADILSQVNPGRVRFFSRRKNMEIINGSSANCMLCTTSYDLRKRGFDVHAGLSTEGYLHEELFGKIYSNYRGTTKVSPSMVDIEKSLLKHGSGSRGNIIVWWGNEAAGGHSMIWENVDGRIQFKDGQTGEVYKDFSKQILKYASSTKPVELLRTDDLSINLPEMKKVINSDTLTKTYVDHGAEIAVKTLTDPRVRVMTTGAAVAAVAVHNQTTKTKVEEPDNGKR